MFFRKNKNQEFKKWHLYVIIIVILFGVGYKIYQSLWDKGLVIINGKELHVLVANKRSKLYEGWSNKSSMGEYDGMLFVFKNRSQHSMVMRNMRFPLDIVWIDGDVIVDIAPNLSPDLSLKEADLRPYFARLSSTMVLEIPAGYTQKNGIKIGDKVKVAY